MKTSAAYINSIDFAYFRTYSFQRTEADKELNRLNDLRRKGVVLTKEQKDAYARLISETQSRHAERIPEGDGSLNSTAVILCEATKDSVEHAALITALSTDIEEEMLWMCPPVYRDAILFYNSRHELTEGIHICFECDRIESIHTEHITTDFKTFKYLKQLLLQWGHEIENPEEFKADRMIETISKHKEQHKQ